MLLCRFPSILHPTPLVSGEACLVSSAHTSRGRGKRPGQRRRVLEAGRATTSGSAAAGSRLPNRRGRSKRLAPGLWCGLPLARHAG